MPTATVRTRRAGYSGCLLQRFLLSTLFRAFEDAQRLWDVRALKHPCFGHLDVFGIQFDADEAAPVLPGYQAGGSSAEEGIEDRAAFRTPRQDAGLDQLGREGGEVRAFVAVGFG